MLLLACRRAAAASLWLPVRFLGGCVDDAPTAENLGALQDTFRADASKAQTTFGSSSELVSGLRSKITIPRLS